MKANDFKLESGQEYTLKHLFNGKNKIVIPDLQRDYCWGDKAWNKDADNYTELVSGFIDNLISSFNEKQNENLTLGLIYGYESPKHHIQLCDGQQRITTLFLLMGMIIVSILLEIYSYLPKTIIQNLMTNLSMIKRRYILI